MSYQRAQAFETSDDELDSLRSSGPPVEVASFEEAIARSGGFGRLQWLASLILILAINAGELLVVNLAYFELMPTYECRADGPDGETYWAGCEPADFCAADGSYDREAVRVDWSSPTSLHNWVEQLDLACEKKATFGLMGSMVFLGWMASATFAPRLSDLHGRKYFFLGFMTMQTAFVAGIALTTSVKALLPLLFLFGLCSCGRLPIAYVYLMELMTERNQKIVGPMINASIGFCMVLSTFLLTHTPKSTAVILHVSLAISVLSIVVTYFLIPESPKFLYATGQHHRCQEAFARIASFNGHKGAFANVTFCESSAESAPLLKGKRGEARELCENKTYLRNLLIMVFTWCTLSFSYYLLNFLLKYLQGDIFMNSYAASGAEIVSKALSSPILIYLGLKALFGLTFGLGAIGALCLVLLPGASDRMTCLFVLVAKFGLSMGWVGGYMGLILTFPTTLVSTAMGCCNLASRALSMLAPMVAELPEVVPLLTILTLCAIAVVLTQFLKVAPQELQPAAKKNEDVSGIEVGLKNTSETMLSGDHSSS